MYVSILLYKKHRKSKLVTLSHMYNVKITLKKSQIYKIIILQGREELIIIALYSMKNCFTPKIRPLKLTRWYYSPFHK